MKNYLIYTAAGLTLAGVACADVEVTMTEVRRLGFLPQDKADYRPEEKLDIKQYNPFAERAKKVEAKNNEAQTETEESRIRAFIKKQNVSGIVKLGDRYIATVGPLIMESGQTLPPLIPGQTQILRVIRVDKSVVELGWVEGTPYDTASPRKIVLKVDMTPRVEVQLASSDGDTKEGSKSTYLVDDNGKLYVPPRTDLMPDASEIADSLPPGSDINPSSALNAEEQSQMNLIDGATAAQDHLLPDSANDELDHGGPPSPASNGNFPARDETSPPPAVPGVGSPALPTEDEVQSDPDLEPPPALGENGNKPAGAP
jgi:hypothetical protein